MSRIVYLRRYAEIVAGRLQLFPTKRWVEAYTTTPKLPRRHSTYVQPQKEQPEGKDDPSTYRSGTGSLAPIEVTTNLSISTHGVYQTLQLPNAPSHPDRSKEVPRYLYNPLPLVLFRYKFPSSSFGQSYLSPSSYLRISLRRYKSTSYYIYTLDTASRDSSTGSAYLLFLSLPTCVSPSS